MSSYNLIFSGPQNRLWTTQTVPSTDHYTSQRKGTPVRRTGQPQLSKGFLAFHGFLTSRSHRCWIIPPVLHILACLWSDERRSDMHRPASRPRIATRPTRLLGLLWVVRGCTYRDIFIKCSQFIYQVTHLTCIQVYFGT